MQAVHPYLQQYLKNAVMVEPVLQQGRKSPSLAAAPGTPVTDQPDTERPHAAAPAGPSTPATNGIEPAGECSHPPENKSMERESEQDNAVDPGNDVAAGCVQRSHPGTREASVDCSSMAYSMDCSAGVFKLSSLG